MGCKAVRSSYSEENEYIFKQEMALGFSGHSPASIEAVTYRLSLNGQFTESAFLRFRDTLHLTTDLEVSYECYKKFQVGEDIYDAKMLLVFGILMSRGTAQEKAIALWNVYKPNGDLEMTKEEAQVMVEGIVSASLDYSLDISLVAPKMSEDRLKVWRQSMTPKVSKAVRGLVDLFFGGNPTLKQQFFIDTVTQETGADVTTTTSIRSIVEQTKAMPSKFSHAFAGGQFAKKLA